MPTLYLRVGAVNHFYIVVFQRGVETLRTEIWFTVIFQRSEESIHGFYATRIKSLRKKSGLTQEQLAEKINVTSTYIVKIENSQRTGSIEFSVELAKCFGVSLDYLLLGEEVGNKKQVLQRVISFLSELEAEL